MEFNVTNLKDLLRRFENTLQMSLYCLIWNGNEDALKTGYGLMLKTPSANFC